MDYYVRIIFLSLFLISGCASTQQNKFTLENRGRSLTDVYEQSVGDAQRDMARYIEDNLKEEKTFGYVKPYIPVVQGPVVRKVWIPEHKSQEDMNVLVGGHWVYLMIEGPKWFIDTESKENQAQVIVPSKSMEDDQK